MKITKYSAKSKMVHKMALKKQLKKAHRELEDESKKYPQQALYTSLLQKGSFHDSDENLHSDLEKETQKKANWENPLECKPNTSKKVESETKNTFPIDSKYSDQRSKKDPFSKAKKQYEYLQQEKEKERQENEIKKQEKEKMHLEQKRKRTEKKKIFSMKTKTGQPKLGQQIGNLLAKIEKIPKPSE